MKRKLFLILALFFLVGLFSVPSALALGEPWEVIDSLHGEPYLDFSEPHGIETDASGNIYVVDHYNDRIKRYTSSGVLDTSWGGGDGIVGGVNGTGSEEFDTPTDITFDASGNMYVVDTYNNRIKRYTPSGALDTSWDGDGIIDGFNHPAAITVDASGNIYVADTGNDRVVSYASDGSLNTNWDGDGILGSWGSGDDRFKDPQGIEYDSSTGMIYIADTDNDRITRYATDGTRDTASFGINGYLGASGSGPDQFDYPRGLSLDAGKLYIVDSNNQRVKRYTSGGSLDTTWGSGGIVGGTEGSGPDEFDYPCDVAVDPSGNVYITDTYNDRIKRYTSSGSHDTSWSRGGILCGYGSDSDQFCYPFGAAIDSSGNLYIVDQGNHRVKCYKADGSLNTAWGSGGIIGGSQGSGPDQFDYPVALAVDSSDYLYVADTDNHRIKRYKPDGTLDTAWGSGGIIGGTEGSGADEFDMPYGLTVDSAENLYVADTGNHRIKRYTASGSLDTAWGSGGIIGTQGSGPDQLDSPFDVATDSSDNLYIADTSNCRIKRYTPGGIRDTSWSSDGIIGSYGTDIEQFYYPYGISVDAADNLYVADAGNRRIKRYTPNAELDSSWFTDGTWQSSESYEDKDSPLVMPWRVTAFDTRVYSVWEDRVLIMCDVETQLKLQDLTVDGSTVTGFSPETLIYTVYVPSTATEIQIGADAMSVYASVSGTGTRTLGSGFTTQLDVTITAETGDTQDYTINVLREGSEVVRLASLSLDGDAVSGFDENVYSYTVTVPYGREYVVIGATGNIHCTSISGDGLHELTGDSTDFTVTAKAADGSKKVYTLTVKIASMDAGWITAAIDGKTFGSSGISIVVPKGGKTVNLRITLEDGTYVDLPISLTPQCSGTTPTASPTEQPTGSPTPSESPEPIPDTSDTSEDAPFIASVDGVEVGSSVTMDVPEGGKTVVLTIEMPDGSVYDIPVELIPEGSISDSAADVSAESIPLTPTAFAWWWIAIGMLGLGTIGLGTWVFVLKRK